MKVLITGAAGFLGRAFTNHHIQAGDWVTGIDDLSNPHSFFFNLDEPIERELGSWLTTPGPKREIHSGETFDLAYHFAAPVGGREKIEGDPLFNADSLRLDSLFFRWAVTHTTTVVYPSSSAVYGVMYQDAEGVPLSEKLFNAGNRSWPAPDEMYGFTKMAGERLAFSAAQYGLHTLCIRPFSGYGPGQSSEYPVPAIAARAVRRDNPILIWGSGEQRRDFIYIDDVVGATEAALKIGVVGYQTLNIGSGESTSFLEVAKLCAQIADYDPAFVTDITKPEGVLTRYADIEKMAHFYEPRVPLREGLAKVMESVW